MIAENLVIISGVSGSGKSTALDAFEDLGYFCVDNLPSPLVESFVSYLIHLPNDLPSPEVGYPSAATHQNFALLLDCRDGRAIKGIPHAVRRLKAAGIKVTLLFFDCLDELVIRRYRETRRPHPLLISGSSAETILDVLAKERELLRTYRECADRVIDTSSFSPHDLRRSIESMIGVEHRLDIVVVSFGFKFGIPHDADLVADIRFLPNPHFIADLRDQTGKDGAVRDYVFSSTLAGEFQAKYVELLQFLLPNYRAEGKRYLTIAVGCTGGRHRSVAFAESLAQALGHSGLNPDLRVTVRHRDVDRLAN